MSSVPILVPQIGEGLREARIAAWLKQPGEQVARDEPVVEIETDKAVMQIEAPHDGVLESWHAQVGDVLPVGAVMATLHAVPDSKNLAVDFRNADVPPRVRAFCRRNGISLETLGEVPRATINGSLTVTDVETWLSNRKGKGYHDIRLSAGQSRMVARLQSSHEIVPAFLETECCWQPLEDTHAALVQSPSDNQPSKLILAAWCVVRAIQAHAKFRSSLYDPRTVREHHHVALGIAVGLPDDELTTAVLTNAETYAFDDFCVALRAQIARAREGEVLHEAPQLILSTLWRFNIDRAVPVVVPPSCATLFIGTPRAVPLLVADGNTSWRQTARLCLAFDHRIINGVSAAAFLQDIAQNIEKLTFAVGFPN